ncbi:AraC family transcriptional regulator [Burkholderia sp. PU8-34]
MTILVRSASLIKYSDIARSVGIDPVRKVQDAGLDPACLYTPDMRIPESGLARVFESSAKSSELQLVGVRIGESWRLADFGALSLYLQHQPTLRHVLAEIEQYRHLLSDSVSIRVENFADIAVMHVLLVTGRPDPGREIVELTVGAAFNLIRTILGAQWKPRGVHFSHRAPDSLRVHRPFFGPNVEFDCEFDAIVLTQQELDRPNPLADAALARYAKELLDLRPRPRGDAIADDVRRVIHILMPQGHCAIELVGQRLGLTSRTLQRQLEQAGESFSALVNEVRCELAVRYLGNRRHTVSEVAALVGFSEISAFSRWFSTEFGKPPTRWRSDFFARAADTPVTGKH